MSFRDIKVGDEVVRLLAGKMPMKLKVTAVGDELIVCGDYPVLDWWRRAWNILRRQGSAGLVGIVGVVSMFMVTGAFGGWQISVVHNANIAGQAVAKHEGSYPQRGYTQIGALDHSAVSTLPPSENGEKARHDQQHAAESSHWVVERFRQEPRQIILVSAVVGALCVAVGFALNMKSRPWLRFAGGCLVFLGLLAPIFPWWLLLFLWW